MPATGFCQNHPEEKILIVCLELFTLHTGKEEGNDMAIYTSLFADGCAAMVMSGEYGENGKWAVEGNYQYLLENSKDAITMGLFERGLFGTINNNEPNIIKTKMKEFMDRFCANFGLKDIEDIEHWCAHPGGPAILKAVQQALEIHDAQLEHSWEFLEQYGNMSSCTVVIIFDRIMKHKETKSSDRMMMLAFGPGVWVESLLLQKY
jgi:predicted naringenin-chalcone synthase